MSEPSPIRPGRFHDTAFPAEQRRGRGAAINPSGRFEPHARSRFDDGWDLEEDLPPLKTSVTLEQARSIINRNDSPDIPFDRSINPYRGCEHGCIYCYARPSHAYMGLSPGVDFETRLFAKPNAAALLLRELGAPSYRPRVIAMGTNTDPYQPIERVHRITRQILEVLARTRHPVGIVTKSALILRDLDILAPMAALGLARVGVSLTTLDRRLARTMEPRAATPAKRLETITRLAQAGIPVTAMIAPIIPAVNESEIEALLQAAHAAGARDAGYVLVRLPLEVSDIFRDFLLREFPDRYRHVMNLLRSMRGGKDYDAEWGKRMRGGGPYAAQIGQRFALAVKRLGLKGARLTLRTDLFEKPADGAVQLSLL